VNDACTLDIGMRWRPLLGIAQICKRLDDQISGEGRIIWRVAEDMSRFHFSLDKLSMHVPCLVLIGEAVALSGYHPLNAALHAWEEDHVAEAVKACLLRKWGQEPGSDQAVVDDHEASRHVATRRGTRSPRDGFILLMGGGEPWFDATCGDETEERILLHQDASFEPCGD